MFDKVKQLNELRKNAKAIQQELDAEVLDVQHKGVDIRINGNMEILDLKTNGKDDATIVRALNESNKQMKKIVEKKMRGRLGDLGLGF